MNKEKKMIYEAIGATLLVTGLVLTIVGSIFVYIAYNC